MLSSIQLIRDSREFPLPRIEMAVRKRAGSCNGSETKEQPSESKRRRLGLADDVDVPLLEWPPGRVHAMLLSRGVFPDLARLFQGMCINYWREAIGW